MWESEGYRESGRARDRESGRARDRESGRVRERECVRARESEGESVGGRGRESVRA